MLVEAQRRIDIGDLDILHTLNKEHHPIVDHLTLDVRCIPFVVENKLCFVLHRLLISIRCSISDLVECCVGSINTASVGCLGDIMLEDMDLCQHMLEYLHHKIHCRSIVVNFTMEFLIVDLWMKTQNRDKVTKLLNVHHGKISSDEALRIIQSIVWVPIADVSQFFEYLVIVSPSFDVETIQPLIRKSDFDPDDVDQFLDYYRDWEEFFVALLSE